MELQHRCRHQEHFYEGFVVQLRRNPHCDTVPWGGIISTTPSGDGQFPERFLRPNDLDLPTARGVVDDPRGRLRVRKGQPDTRRSAQADAANRAVQGIADSPVSPAPRQAEREDQGVIGGFTKMPGGRAAMEAQPTPQTVGDDTQLFGHATAQTLLLSVPDIPAISRRDGVRQGGVERMRAALVRSSRRGIPAS
jgi:hypothetical protein